MIHNTPKAERVHTISEKKTVAYNLQKESSEDPRSALKMHVVRQMLKLNIFLIYRNVGKRKLCKHKLT